MTKSQLKVLDKVTREAKEAQMVNDACGWSTLYGLSRHFNFIPEELVAATTSLSGGCGASNGSCGAYVCGLLAIGWKFNPPMGDDSPPGIARKEIAGRKLKAFREAFIKAFGTTMCPVIHEKIYGRSFDLMDERERDEFFAIPDHKERCALVVTKGARLAAEIMLEED
jgi:hypothetical protein